MAYKKKYRSYPVGSTFIDPNDGFSGRVVGVNKRGGMIVNYYYQDSEGDTGTITYTPREASFNRNWKWTVPPIIFIL